MINNRGRFPAPPPPHVGILSSGEKGCCLSSLLRTNVPLQLVVTPFIIVTGLLCDNNKNNNICTLRIMTDCNHRKLGLLQHFFSWLHTRDLFLDSFCQESHTSYNICGVWQQILFQHISSSKGSYIPGLLFAAS